MTRSFIVSNRPSLIAARRTSAARSSSSSNTNNNVAPRSARRVAVAASNNNDQESSSSSSSPPSMFRRLALALGVASATGGAGTASSARAAETIPADLPQSEEAWKARLSPEAFYVLRKHGTERPFTSPLNGEKRKGTFVCAGCGTRLFSSSAKFDSGTGWPSFFAPLSNDGSSVEESEDNSFFMRRTEVRKREREREKKKTSLNVFFQPRPHFLGSHPLASSFSSPRTQHRSTARSARGTSATCSRTVPGRRGCATA